MVFLVKEGFVRVDRKGKKLKIVVGGTSFTCLQGFGGDCGEGVCLCFLRGEIYDL